MPLPPFKEPEWSWLQYVHLLDHFLETVRASLPGTHAPKDYCENDPGVNVIATVDIEAVEGVAREIAGLFWSYDDEPTGGRLWITCNGTTRFDWDITQGGPGPVNFIPPLKFDAGAPVQVHLAAGGAGVTGKITVQVAR